MASVRSKVARCVAALAAGALLAGCGPGDSGASNLRFGAIYLDSQGFYAGVKKGIETAAAKDSHLKLLGNNAQGDAAKESSFMSTMVASKVDAIITSAVSATASVPSVAAASKAGIPVICYNTCINDADAKKYVWGYVLSDPYVFGKRLGEQAGKYFTGQKITNPKIAVLNCDFVEVCKERKRGFKDGLKETVPGAQYVADQEGAVVDKATPVAENIITANPNLDAFYAVAGGGTLAGVKAVTTRNRVGKTVVFGSDMTVDIAKALVDGRILKAEIDVPAQTVGKLSYEAARKAANGEKNTSFVIPVQPILYTADDKATNEKWLTEHADGIP
ncbi:substrate-binding domain-containing protein [Actinomadura alba]|uniref:Substrate-binding domain-containing protein n=1 Tax=Actinomadura alba TaxID=406431 RepID=A0ABR7LQE7_9ACTN|nr:substrate-binding domain-containing protein [Actinomadura alba]MBC6466722.1 substrate-binding domain-containing protein [Actinomadura alba]